MLLPKKSGKFPKNPENVLLQPEIFRLVYKSEKYFPDKAEK